MYLPTSNYLKRNLASSHPSAQNRQQAIATVSHPERIKRELADTGLSRIALSSSEAKYLPNLIKSDEHIEAAVYGKHKDGAVMLVATDRRVVFLDKKPLFINDDELSYGMVGGVTISTAGFGTTVELHTRMRDYKITTLKDGSAIRFADYIENRCLEYGTPFGTYNGLNQN